MKLVHFLIFVNFISCFESPLCNSYHCNGQNEDICMEAKNGSIKLHVCLGSRICDYGLGNDISYCRDHIKSLYPGEYCTNSDDCLSGICKNNMCILEKNKSTCELDADCNFGFYCNANMICVPIILEENICTANDKCDSGLVCSEHICVKIGSKNINDTATAPAACKSYFIHNSRCAEGPKLIVKENKASNAPTTCSGKCKYSYADNEIYEYGCVCGMRLDPNPLCNPGIGDIDIN